MAISLGTLLIELKAETAAFSSALDKAAQLSVNKSEDMKKAFTAAGVAISGALASAGGAIVEMVSHAAEAADHLNKLSQSAGVSVEALSSLGYAAKLSDIDLEALGNSLEKLSKHMFEAADKGGNSAAAFDRLGIAVKDSSGHLRNIEDVMRDLAGKFAGMEDGAAKTALSMQLFGKAGAVMIPLLNQGSAGLAQMTEEARKLGITIDGETSKAAEEFHDNLVRLEGVLTGVGNAMLRSVAPALSQISERLVQAAKDSDTASKTGMFSEYFIKAAIIGFGLLQTIIDDLGDNIKNVGAAMINVARGDFAGAVESIKQYGRDSKQVWQEAIAGMVQTWNAGIEQIQNSASKSSKSSGPSFLATTKQEVLQLKESMSLAAPDVSAAMAKIWNSISVPKGGKEGLEAINDILDKQVQKTADKMKDASDDAKRVWDETRTPLEKYNEELKKLDDLLQQGAIDQDTYNRKVRQMDDDLAKTNQQVDEGSKSWRQFGQEADDALKSAILHGQGFGQALKAILVDLVEVILKATVFKNLMGSTGGGGGGGIGGIFGSIITGIFGGHKAAGGPVEAGKGYMVGENGPEPFFPNVNGFILPNSALAGGGSVSITQINDFRGADPGSEVRIRRMLEQNKRETVQTAIQAMREVNRRT
jgi:ABC-type transporter Mla subunit MlaD